MINNKLLIGLAVCGFAVFSYIVLYPIGDWLFNDREYYRGRFLITATVEVNGELKSGSSVYEVSYNARRRGGGFGSSPINGARGTMPVIDLGEYGRVIFSFEDSGPLLKGSLTNKKPPQCTRIDPSGLPSQLMIQPNKNYSDFREVLQDIKKTKSKSKTDFYYPIVTLVTKKNVYRSIAFCDLTLVSNNFVKAVELSIQHTNLPLDSTNPHPDLPRKYSYWSKQF